MIGTSLAHYRITAKLGEGGMGEVYKAVDSKLNREVAIKVLPPAVANDPERLLRFQREAQVLAALNHPNIAQIYGIEQNALVMELVQGHTLSVPQPIETAIQYARQIADALEAAHEKGIVHRDLKPGNIMVTSDGTVKVLDFGLAAINTAQPSDPANSPTLTMRATEAGLIIGTAAYMSPEQAAGKPVDKRADIWSYGVVLFELLTGEKLFNGETVSHTLADVLRAPIDIARLPANTPGNLRKLIARCLDRDIKTRLRDIGEARVALTRTEAPEKPATQQRPVLWMALAGVATLAAIAATALYIRQTPPPPPVHRFQLHAPDNTSVHTLAISPDGRYLAVSAGTGRKAKLWLRPLDSLTYQLIPGTDDARYPFWSPDSRHIGFFAEGKLRRIPVEGGAPLVICNAVLGRGGTWNKDGVILFSPSGENTPILRVSAAGGQPSPATTQPGSETQRFPWFLPDGEHFLFSVDRSTIKDRNGIYIGSLDGKLARRINEISDPLVSSAAMAFAAKNGPAYLLTTRDSALIAVPFNLESLAVAGEPIPVAPAVSRINLQGIMASISAAGILVYDTAQAIRPTQIAWVDRSGKVIEKLGEPGLYSDLALSPDGKTLAAVRTGQFGQLDSENIWLRDLARSTEVRFTTSFSHSPVWSPDGLQIIFTILSEKVRRKDVNGSTESEFAAPGKVDDWSGDGRFLLATGSTVDQDAMLWAIENPFGPPEQRQQFRLGGASLVASDGRFSPDGKSVAYAFRGTGRSTEVFVRSFPAGISHRRISLNGGRNPTWRRDGQELFFLGSDNTLMTASLQEGVPPKALFPLMASNRGERLFERTYVPAPDGQRFLILVPAETLAPPLTLVTNWHAALK